MSHLHSDSDDEPIDDELTLMRNLKYSLFKGPPSRKRASSEPLGDNVDTLMATNERCLLAVTVNPDPFALMNKRMYKLYTNDKQRAMLTRIENAARVTLGDINLKKLTFEICPKLGQVHYHALYDLPSTHVTPLELYIMQRVSRKNGPSWRAFQSETVYDEKGWIRYITKDV